MASAACTAPRIASKSRMRGQKIMNELLLHLQLSVASNCSKRLYKHLKSKLFLLQGHSAKNDLSMEVLRDFCTRETFLRGVPDV